MFLLSLTHSLTQRKFQQTFQKLWKLPHRNDSDRGHDATRHAIRQHRGNHLNTPRETRAQSEEQWKIEIFDKNEVTAAADCDDNDDDDGGRGVATRNNNS